MNKCTIKKVDNGFIVTVTDQGKSSLKTLYQAPVVVFTTLAEVVQFLEVGFSEEELG